MLQDIQIMIYYMTLKLQFSQKLFKLKFLEILIFNTFWTSMNPQYFLNNDYLVNKLGRLFYSN